MPRKQNDKWEVVDGYNKVHFTGTLKACGVWIDPVLGIDWHGTEWPHDADEESVDDDRIELRPDGSYVVTMYNFGGISGGELFVRPCST